MLLNPKATEVFVDGKEYSITRQDYGSFQRLNIFHAEKRIGFRDLGLLVDQSDEAIQYLIRRMVGNYGPISKTKVTEDARGRYVKVGTTL